MTKLRITDLTNGQMFEHNWARSARHLPRYYFPKDEEITIIQLHGFCDASEDAYAGVVYIRGQDVSGHSNDGKDKGGTNQETIYPSVEPTFSLKCFVMSRKFMRYLYKMCMPGQIAQSC